MILRKKKPEDEKSEKKWVTKNGVHVPEGTPLNASDKKALKEESVQIKDKAQDAKASIPDEAEKKPETSPQQLRQAYASTDKQEKENAEEELRKRGFKLVGKSWIKGR